MLLSMGLKESDMTEQLNNNNKYNSQIIIKIKIIFTEMSSCGRVGICYMSALVMVILCGLSSVQLSHSVVSDSLQSHGLQHARLPCPSPFPRACPNSHPLSR